MSSYTGVTFGAYHSYDDWGLKLTGVEIGMPEAKTDYVDVPGMNGYLDLTEAQNGRVRYGMRSLVFTFNARHCDYGEWLDLISTISAAIEGQQIKIILDFDSGYYYTGRCHIDTEKTNQVLAQVTIEANCDPYKMYVDATGGSYTISSSTTVGITGYPYNDTLTVVSSAEMTMTFDGTEYEIDSGTNLLYGVDLEEGTNYLYFTGTGTVIVTNYGGRI